MSGGLTEADEAINKRVQEVAEKKGWKMSQVALAWLREGMCAYCGADECGCSEVG